MAVFTTVGREVLAGWLDRYEVGVLLDFEGIPSGIENTNYFVAVAPAGAPAPAGRVRPQYVLTLFERLSAAQLPFYLQLMKHLAAAGIPCPDPVPARDGGLWSMLEGKPAALVTRLAGRSNMQPGPAECAQVGALLARMHLAAGSFHADQPNLRGLSWWVDAAPKVRPFLAPGLQQALADEVRAQQRFAQDPAYARLPASAVHADLFRDNVLFDGATLSGVIDFYFAGVDTWLFDLAVTANDWCGDDASGEFVPARLDALLSAYRAHRELTDDERRAWPLMQRAAALRFWLSRLYDLHLPRPAEMVTPKDPTHFERILVSRRIRPHMLDD